MRPGAISDPFLRRNAARLREPALPPLDAGPIAPPPQAARARRTASPFPDRDSQEPTRAAPLDTAEQATRELATARGTSAVSEPVRARTLPDLDISGIAQLVEEPPGFALAGGLDQRATVVRAPRVDLDAREAANGRRRLESAPDAEEVAPRHSRYSQLFDDPETHDGVIYSDGESARRSSIPAPRGNTPRPTPRPSSAPPAVRNDKTAIAVRPLPAPEVLDPRLVMLTDPYSPRAEAYRTLRRKLSGPGAPKTIAITSAEPGEGKTSCAVNLALAFRETSNEKVLLIEANLRAPSLAKLFAFEPPVCFAKQMAKNRETDRSSWTVAEQFEPLHVLAVDPASRTSPMMDPVAFANALEQLVEAGYDHIVIDTPPALGGSDVNLVADVTDGVVVVAWIRKSKKSQVKKAIDQLKPATILGVVTLDG
ncbi:MAG: CpsD/CapB family tyrosine-protein kinase [Polyangiaceae bacterium]